MAKRKLKILTKGVIRKHPTIAIIVSIFLLLFVGGFRFNPFNSFIIALINTGWTLLVFYFFNWFLNRVSTAIRFKSFNIIIISILLIISVLAIVFIENLTFQHWLTPTHKPDPRNLIYPIFKNTILVLGAFIGTMSKYASSQQQRADLLLVEQQQMELRLLRSQMNPHFVFNSLNNIYSLVYTKSENAADAILKISKMLRYVTDECQAETVSIDKEITYIENYIELQKLNLGDIPNFTFDHDIDNPLLPIPPMILQPFIENCFKYGNITDPNGYISLQLSVRNNYLFFNAINSKKKVQQFENQTNSGIGIANIKRRLELFYKDNYHLEITDSDAIFEVLLTITIPKI